MKTVTENNKKEQKPTNTEYSIKRLVKAQLSQKDRATLCFS